MMLILDNYDSFTYNLKQAIEGLGFSCRVFRNDAVSVKQIIKLKPEKIIISPGPGNPSSAGITLELIVHVAGKIPILGICLGHQAIGQAFGAKVVRAPRPFHGKLSTIHHKKIGMFKGLPTQLEVARYHSLIVDRESLP